MFSKDDGMHLQTVTLIAVYIRYGPLDKFLSETSASLETLETISNVVVA